MNQEGDTVTPFLSGRHSNPCSLFYNFRYPIFLYQNIKMCDFIDQKYKMTQNFSCDSVVQPSLSRARGTERSTLGDSNHQPSAHKTASVATGSDRGLPMTAGPRRGCRHLYGGQEDDIVRSIQHKKLIPMTLPSADHTL